jgi:protease-4
VHQIAQGRVWPGEKAMEIELVDEIGNLQDALNKGVELAELEDYKIREYPKTKNPFEMLLENFSNSGGSSPTIRKELESYLAESFPHYQLKREYEEMKGVQMRLPYYLDFNKQSSSRMY